MFQRQERLSRMMYMRMNSMKYGSVTSDIYFLCGFSIFCFQHFLYSPLTETAPPLTCMSVCVMTLDQLIIIIYWFFCWSGDLSWNSGFPPSCELASMCLCSHMSGKQTGRTQWCQLEGCMKHHNHLGQLVRSP